MATERFACSIIPSRDYMDVEDGFTDDEVNPLFGIYARPGEGTGFSIFLVREDVERLVDLLNAALAGPLGKLLIDAEKSK